MMETKKPSGAWKAIKVTFLLVGLISLVIYIFFATGTAELRCKECAAKGDLCTYEDEGSEHHITAHNPYNRKKYKGKEANVTLPKGLCKCGHKFSSHVKFNLSMD